VRLLRALIITASAIGLLGVMGCASGPNVNSKDPIEPLNRKIHSFNESVDDAVIKPVATTYRNYTPEPFQYLIKNFFGNLRDVWSTANNAFQLKPAETAEDGARVLINTFLGIYGLIDLATPMGIERHNEDFGQTLGYWGVPSGPYIVLPLLGPSTLRDTVAMPVDTEGNLVRHINHVPTRNSAYATNLVDQRAGLLNVSKQVDDLALDKYSFVRDAFLQKRLNDVYDGNPPDTDNEDRENSNQ